MNYLYREVHLLCLEHTSQKRDTGKKNTALEREWRQQPAEKFLKEEGQGADSF